MSNRTEQLRRRSELCRGIALLLACCSPLAAFAQLAPVMGGHYTRPGVTGAVNSVGAYGASVPLDLPEARGALPVPVQVVYGGNQVGAAGMGWDVPFSTIVRSKSLAYRRPKPGTVKADGSVDPQDLPERLTLSLGGGNIDLILNADGTAWVARQGDAQLEVRSTGSDTMALYDGNGLTYTFSAQGAAAGSQLDNGNLYLLRNITGTGGTVRLSYAIGAPDLPGGATGLSINLASVVYNQSPADPNCFKHKIQLNYDAPAAAPLSMSILGGTVLARTQKLASISVDSKATCASSPVSLRRYDFVYQTDPDTQRPQLQKVTMVGQQGTPERNVTLPVATYGYGTLTDSNGDITYHKTHSISVPNPDSGVAAGISLGVSDLVAISSTEFLIHTPQQLINLTGDGRPEFVTSVGALRNNPSGNAQTSFASLSFSDGLGNFDAGHGFDTLTATSTDSPRYDVWQRNGGCPSVLCPKRSTTDTLKQYIDINGDGRMDFIDAASPDFHWLVRLNMPDPADPSKSVIVTRTIDIKPMQEALGLQGQNVPLSRSVTLAVNGTMDCYKRLATSWAREFKDCPDWQQAVDFNSATSETTLVLWELKDVNGDGYPDLVYDKNPAPMYAAGPAPTDSAPEGTYRIVLGPIVDLSGPRDVGVLYNSAGVHLVDGGFTGVGTPVFESPAILDADGCGVGRWEAVPGAVSSATIYHTCGFEDVNGDGLADRITSEVQPLGPNLNFVSRAALGTGKPDHPFTTSGNVAGATIALPGTLSRILTNLAIPAGKLWGAYEPVPCTGGQKEYGIEQTQLLRDINGDGLPDHITMEPGEWYIRFGTGTGFTAQKRLVLPAGLLLGKETSTCPGKLIGGQTIAGRTTNGLYDLDGDGQPEVLEMNRDTTNLLDVYQLKSPIIQFEMGGYASVPQAGRLIKIDNGYGASTRLSYQSAKVDIKTPHDVPNPEIVVGAERTTESTTAASAATTRRAYGKAGLVFDSVQDRFVFPGYGRTVTTVETQHVVGSSNAVGLITITDAYGLAPFVPGSDAAARLKRYLTTGQVSDVTILRGDNNIVGLDAWQFLGVDTANDPRRISGAHYDWDVRLLASGQALGTNEPCVEMMYPYDYSGPQGSLANALSPNDECIRRGFLFQKENFSWRGTPGTADPRTVSGTVKTGSSVEAVDDLGRTTQARHTGDLTNADDDLCVQTTYAVPVANTPGPRVLNAPASATVTNCAATPVTLSQSSTEYDALPVGQVSNGFVTAQIASRLDENGQPLPYANGNSNVRQFDATYDAMGNVLALTRTRDDGAVRTESFAYDPFNLAVTSTTTTASGGIPPLTSSIERDPITLYPLNTTDPNGARQGALYDGFGRVLQSLVTPAGGSEGALSSLSYKGFAVGETGGRRVEQKVFTDPVDPATAATAAGRIGTTYFDELGRPTRTDVQLGADYGNKVMVAGERLYDLLGRVEFEADPHPSDESLSTAYGTTWKFNVDGTPQCTIRGPGKQALSQATNEGLEIYPTCFNHEYLSNKELLSIRDASSNLAGSPQEGVRRSLLSDAAGRVQSDWTFSGDGQLIKDLRFGYDALGRRTSLTRQGDLNTVTTRWHYDSFGQVVQLDEPGSQLNEPGSVPQFRSYNSWGQLTQMHWTDATTESTTLKRSINSYDALGRLVHSEDRNNQSIVPETVRDFVYDQAFSNATPAVTATHVLGRLAKATADTSSVFFSYDGLGRVNAQVFNDRANNNRVFVQKNQYHGDGSSQSTQLLLPDHSFAPEQVNYGYDSAGRPRSVTYTDGTTTQLFKADQAIDLDVFGRIRHAQFGLASFNATFADTGRRLIQEMQVTTPSLKSRRIAFAPLQDTPASITAFDPTGRERTRQEYVDGVQNKVQLFNYDSQGRLSALTNYSPFSVSQFTYDPLGNLTQLTDGENAPDNAATMSYKTTDRDRICSIGYDDNVPAEACDVSYDAVGNIKVMPTRNGTRSLSYFPGGQVRQITQGNTVATYDYDAFGAVQRLVVGPVATTNDNRNDKYFGGMIVQRQEGAAQVITRKIPVPGAVATRHGVTGNWTFAFGESRGTRFVTGENGEFVQTVDYQPFGEVKNPTGASPGTTDYTREQWNDGDLLAAFGVNQLGARIYDPVIGRFLSRDPVFDAANDFNPYTFAANDPINNADPTGMDLSESPGNPNPDTLPPLCYPCHTPRPPGNWHNTGPSKPGKTSTTLTSHEPYVWRDSVEGRFAALRAAAAKDPFPREGWSFPDILGPVIDAGTELLTDALADTANGIVDVNGGIRPGHATTYAELEPSVHTVVSGVVHASDFALTSLGGGSAFGADDAITLGKRAFSSLSGDAEILRRARLTKRLKNTMDLPAHGSEQTITLGGRKVYADEAAKMTRNDPAFHGQDIRLMCCKAGRGKNPFAQQYATYMGTRVRAATGDALLGVKGRYRMAPKSVEKVFHPDGPVIGISRIW